MWDSSHKIAYEGGAIWIGGLALPVWNIVENHAIILTKLLSGGLGQLVGFCTPGDILVDKAHLAFKEACFVAVSDYLIYTFFVLDFSKPAL